MKMQPQNKKTNQINRHIVNPHQASEIIIDESSDKEKLRKAQTMMLQMQINPHFLGNTLNVINWMALEMTMSDNPVSNAIGKLARLFKSYSDATDYMTDFESEIEFTNQYADILKLRYPDTFSLEWNIDQKALNARVPRIILQPLVENAVYHGIKPLDKKSFVKIESFIENNLLNVVVEDNGRGMSDEAIRHINDELAVEEAVYNGHVGLKNVNQRLKLIYGNEYGIKLEKSETGGLRVKLLFPYMYLKSTINYTEKSSSLENNVLAARETVELVLNRMMSIRKKCDVDFLPYTTPIGYNPCWPSFNFEEIYKEWEAGDVGYVAVNIIGPQDKNLVISITGDNDIVFNGKSIQSYESERIPEAFKIHSIRSYRVKFLEGENILIVRQKAQGEYFKFEIYIGEETGPATWPVEYYYKVRPLVPFGSMKGMEGFGFSRLYKNDEILPELNIDSIEWIGPEAPKDVTNIEFDFNTMTSYNVAAAITWAKGNIALTHISPIRVYVDKEKVYDSDNGIFTAEFTQRKMICVEADSAEKGFGFKAESGDFLVPGYKSQRKDLSWLWLEGVRNASEKIQFKKPFTCYDGKKTFFRYLREGTYYRLYLNSYFFGGWHYATMLGHYGLLKTAQLLGRQEYIDYFIKSIEFLCDYYDYAQYDGKTFGSPALLYSSLKLSSLNTTGPVGMAVCELVKLTGSESGKRLIKLLEEAVQKTPKTKDGVFYRIDSVAVDDFFMLLPFYARLGGDYITEGIRQLKEWCKYLYMEDKKVFSHIYFMDEEKQNRVAWSRGNGWAMFAISDFLMYIPENHPQREYVLKLFRDFAEGILRFQDESGIWHLIIDDHDTFEETSGTGMYIASMARGVKMGWLNRDIVPKLWKAWNRLSEICINDDGSVIGICAGAGIYMERESYKKMGTCIDDEHGVGAVLWAGAEMTEL